MYIPPRFQPLIHLDPKLSSGTSMQSFLDLPNQLGRDGFHEEFSVAPDAAIVDAKVELAGCFFAAFEHSEEI
jgi:hypothetical protein